MPRVAALYRYPVKGFTPEPRGELTIQPDGRVAGDRVLAFRFASGMEPEDRDGLPYWNKRLGLALMTFPSLARLRLTLADQTLTITDDGSVLVSAGLDDAGRALIAERVTEWLRDRPEARRLMRPGVLPLTLVGDGVTARYQDRAPGHVSLHGSATTRALDAALPGSGDDRRYRSNIVIAGSDPWEELTWRGRVRIGSVELATAGEMGRCLATHANPDTGERDAEVLATLVTEFGQSDPTLGLLLTPTGGGGTIRVGDEVVPR